ncbi:lysosomal-trafficking regulator isoform X2 [Episyrphus balteatus]|uniref:lysosomal-trafficking regulator isoform X2 n=1 Tax=Episyrphus balteatus TaxID=286459 RepID=UPI00248654F5|nr:lysosomal-trafficking regulator isoform X2 [Episyrphus balteatus]
MDELSVDQELLKELQTLWTNYEEEEKDSLQKEQALKLFLYKFQFVNLEASLEEPTPISCFVQCVLEEICSFLLERVYDIISKSHLTTSNSSSKDDIGGDDDNDGVGSELTSESIKTASSVKWPKDKKHNFAQLILRAPSDYSKIVALRTFLTHEIGHHILYFLRRVDIKLLASQLSLCNICINLFPNCQWNSESQVQLNPSNSIREFLDNLLLHQRLKALRSRDFSQSSELKSTLNDSTKLFYIEHQPNDFDSYANQIRTSDEIAVVLIDLLEKLVDIETDMILNDQSISVICWKFGVEKLSINEEVFCSAKNCEIIKCKLLNLVGKSFNNICWQRDNLASINLHETINKLMKALEITTHPEIIFGIIYLIFGLMNNIIALSYGKFHNALKFIDEDSLDMCVFKLSDLLAKNSKELTPFFPKIVKVLQKIIENLNKNSPSKSKKHRKKFKGILQQHCLRNNFPCFFQKILINIVQHLPSDLQNYVLRCLQRQGVCCCLCNTDTMKIFLSQSIEAENQKYAYSFVHQKLLTTVFLRNNCTCCEFKLKSNEFHKEVFQLYRNKYDEISNFDEYKRFLKHLKHISHLISFDISTGLLANIVLPIFRTYKEQSLTCENNNRILIECLNIFITYLSDVRLIKAFYNGENISHLEDLLHRPELIRPICDLIKIGIENAAFLGDNSQEQVILSKRLIALQLDGSVTSTKSINGMLRHLISDRMIWLDKEDECIEIAEINALHTLHVASRHWYLNYQLLKINQQFQIEFAERFEQIDLIKLACNTLSCFLLFSKEINQEVSSPQLEECPTTPMLDSLPLDSLLSASSVQTSMTASEPSNFDDVIKFYNDYEVKGFLNKLQSNSNTMDESIVLFDIRNQLMALPRDQLITEGKQLLAMDDSSVTEDQKSLLGRIFGYIFGSQSTSSTDNLKESETTDDNDVKSELQCLCKPGDCKNLLLKLFESAMAVYVRENKEDSTDTMQNNLQRLKLIILSRALQDWNQTDPSITAVTLALQSLLKIAELTGTFSNEESHPINQRDEVTAHRTHDNVDEPTLASTESDADFYSTRASLICADSEIDLSENDTEEFYLTADEGYEADGEIPGMSESEEEIDDLWVPFTPSSRYRTHVVHSGICKIVTEILIELSLKCSQNPSAAWANSLSQLAARMFVIREFLGGPLFILQGFLPLLQSNDAKLRELQQTILDLVVDLNSPDVLSTYFNILASKNPPVDILIKYMSYICSNSLKKQPTVEIEFPMLNDGKCVSSTDPLIAEQIERVRNYHLFNHANTAFLRSACVLPITHAKVWGSDGLTVSLWMQMKSSMPHRSASQIIDDDIKISCDESMRTHILSIGSNQAIISVYVNSNMNLVFESSKPNAELSPKSPNHEDNAFMNKENVSTNTSPQSISPSPFRNALKHTKLVILNSFNQMHFFHGHGVTDGYFEGSSVELKYFRLCRSKWTHLSFSVDLASDRFNLTVTLDGLEQHAISLPFRNVRNLTRTSTFQLLSLGDSIPKANCNDSLECVSGIPLKFSISNVILFNRKIPEKEIIQYLTAMGPDFVDITQCQVGAWKPNFGFLNLNKSFNVKVGSFQDAMKVLRESRFCAYSASDPNAIMAYDQMSDYDNSCGKRCGIMLYGKLCRNELQSVQTSTILCGGLSTLLYLFARVVELTSDSATQSMSLDLLLTVALSDSQLYTEFMRNDYFSLIGYVIKTDRCTKDVFLLASIINNSCTQPVIIKKGSTIHVNENTIACLSHPMLIANILHRFSDWHRSGSDSSEGLELLFKTIIALVRDKHPCKEFNMKQLNRVGLMKELLNLCKVYVVESPNPIHISIEAANSFVNILSIFAGSPPSASLMDEIMKLLLLLHKPSECFITHDRSNLYFLLSTEGPVKEKGLGLQIPRRQLKQIFRERKRSSSASLFRSAKPSKILEKKSVNGDSMKFNGGLRSKSNMNLETIANCSRLNQNEMRMLSPLEPAKWRLKPKRHSLHNIPHSSPKNSPLKIIRKRVRLMSKPSNQNEKKSRMENSMFDSSPPSSHDEQQGGVMQSKDGFKWPLENSFFSKKKSKTMFKTDFYSSPGIMKLQERLFILLKDFLFLLPDNVVEEVLTHYVKMEILLVLANHTSPTVRTAILKLLTALTKRIPPSELGVFTKKFFPQHLANQLAIYSTDVNMFETCLEWVTGLYGSLEAFAEYEYISINNRFGLHSLLSILTKTDGQANFSAKAFKVLKTIYLTDPEDNHSLIETGLLQCCMKALHNMYVKPKVSNTLTEESIIELLTCVGEKAMKSSGQMNIIWDILNMLSFYQLNNPTNVVKGFRSVQGKLQLNWLDLFFKNRSPSSNFKVTVLPNSSINLSETKTRLDLLIDRCSQFFTNYGPTYMPNENELKLFEQLVLFGISTNTRCNNFIAWGLLSSRPLDLRQFIIDTLWMACQNETLPTIICDGKMIKSLLWLCLLEQKSNNEKPIENLDQLCLRLGIKDTDTTWNLEQELERFEQNRNNTSAKHKLMLEKTIHKFESLANSCIETSMVITRVVAELQNSERKILMNHMKEYDENYTFHKWLEIIRRMTHEGAPWFSIDRSEMSFELDDTEGPSRVHTRLRRCHLDIDKRFIMEDYRQNSEQQRVEYIRPLDYLISSYDQQLNISLNSQILYNFPAKYLPVDAEIDGEIIVTDHKLYFIATYRCKYFYVSCDVDNITEIWLKRYQHQEKAFEIFLETNKSLLFSLQNQDDWKIMKEVFLDKIVVCPDQNKILLITQQWREGLLTNWEYIMTLNQIAGRTYNDLMQYPVFPWILANYTTDVLDLTEKKNFRKLEKPIAVQHEENEQHYVNNYTYINNTMTSMGTLQIKPYHYSSHYSNSGTVLHFLVRVPPFTSYFLRYQDNNFDLPDRTFHSLATTWSLASKDSPTDVKELIPEFFCLPEMFENFERFDFGCRQSGERVEDVLLPPWCLRDPRLFVLIHRQALESEIVRQNIHNWIDLIFGHNQTGQNAVDTINVFHPATYAVFLESEITDPIERKAVETMVKTYGQMPKQLFKTAHPSSKPLNYCLGGREVIPTAKGLRWGVFLGSPQLPTPTLGNINKLPGSDFLVSFNNTNVVYGLPAKSCVMRGPESDTFNVISWGYDDRIVRIQPLSDTQTKSKALLFNSSFDDITCCGSDANSNLLWCGHKSGRISVYKCSSVDPTRIAKSRQSYVKGIKLSYNSAFRKISPKSSLKVDDLEQTSEVQRNNVGVELKWSGPTILIRHTDEITTICLSVEFKIAVSAGKDGIAVIWDLNDLSYVRTIERPAEIHHSPINLTAISPTLGDIVTVHSIPRNDSELSTTPVQADECFEVTEESLDDFVNVSINPSGKSILRLHSVNARYVNHIVHEDSILAVCYSYIKEGVGVNVIATAVEGGIVRLWSSWNLSFVAEIPTGITNIKSITYSTHQHLVVLTKDSYIQVWESEGLYGNPPKFPQIVFK